MPHPSFVHSTSRAIIHIDGDSFFASCEQAVNPALRGKPIITGKERGIASAVSIEAKKLGIKRGMSIGEIRRICPDIIYVPSDYETYSLFSKRMFDIVRRYTSIVEEYGIDECFAEITGLRRYAHLTYTGMATKIKSDLENELGLSFSVGLGPSKVTAKLASKWNKPSGLVIVNSENLDAFLAKTPVAKVWGIGPQTTKYLEQFGIITALDLAKRGEDWVREKLTKPHQEIWHELRGESVMPLVTEEKHDYHSVSKTKTFTPPSRDRSYLLSQLSKNTENACIKLRRHDLAAKRFFFFVKTQDFRYAGYEITLSRHISSPNEIVRLIDEHLDRIFTSKKIYRATGVVLSDLQSNVARQADLFGESVHSEKVEQVFRTVDEISERYGKHTVFLGQSFKAITGAQYAGDRADKARRAVTLFRGEGKRKRLGIPMMGEAK